MSEPHHHPKLSDSSPHLSLLRRGERTRLLWVLVLTGVTMVAEFAGSAFTRSISLFGDAVHMLTHFLSVGLSVTAIWIATRPAPPEKTYRYWRVEILATLINALALLPVAGYVVYEAVLRLGSPVAIHPVGTIVVGGIGLVVNLASAAILHRHSKEDLNTRGAFLHMLSDTASSVGVLLAGLAVLFLGWTWADPAVAAGIAVLIILWSASLLRSSCEILLESVPRHMDLEEIRAAIRGFDGVEEVHDLHVWTITTRMYALTAHVRLREDLPVSRSDDLGRRVERMLDERWEIQHATLQFEHGDGRGPGCEHEESEGAGGRA